MVLESEVAKKTEIERERERERESSTVHKKSIKYDLITCINDIHSLLVNLHLHSIFLVRKTPFQLRAANMSRQVKDGDGHMWKRCQWPFR